MKKKYFKLSILTLYGIIIGGFVGLLTWSFLSIINLGVHFLWHTLPSYFSIKYWTVIMCLIGGLLVGLCQKFFGEYPRKMPEVVSEYKETNRVDYKNIHKATLSALIVLLFGASLGPEAALVGIVGGLVTWTGDILKSFFKENEEFREYTTLLTNFEIKATMALIFRAPLYGISDFFNDKNDSSAIKKLKVVIYSITTLSGFLIFTLLLKIDNRPSFSADFGSSIIGNKELISTIPLILVGISIALLYEFFGKVLHTITNPLNKHKIFKAILGGLILGLIGTLLPSTLFSGEHELKVLAVEWSTKSAYLLIITGFCKLFVTEVCLSTGWRGGHIFPIVFSGISIGYGFSMIFSLDPVLCAAIITASLTSTALKSPLVALFLLIIFFPLNLWPLMIVACFIPKYLLKLKKSKTITGGNPVG
ncbi:chloride channel protein [Clostridium gasigenes]|uniref:chloride channel protein n=1 Tax=Clostridium gasigenes TaxID=94869 RepID=UPI001C0BFF2F|nr:chloride channel protein [Clostridium gasigenes]MBU3133869.1 chloride channel protein [Clostridium gasigenes]